MNNDITGLIQQLVMVFLLVLLNDVERLRFAVARKVFQKGGLFDGGGYVV